MPNLLLLNLLLLNLFIILFGGRSGCAGRGCLFWILISVVLSVVLTVLVNLVLLLFSDGGAGVGV